MWISMSEVYRQEKNLYKLKACCEECIYYCAKRDKCGIMYPVHPHKTATFENVADGDRIYFCKMFEAK